MDAQTTRPAALSLRQHIEQEQLELVRFAWSDLHGALRTKTLTAAAAAEVNGIGMVSTLVLKDTSDRTAYKVFEPGGTEGLEDFAFAGNFVLKPDVSSFRTLPWAHATGWVLGDLHKPDGTPLSLDTRGILRHALHRLAGRGLGFRCGLEVEFHIYRIHDESAELDPAAAEWPGGAPSVEMIHPGYYLLSELWFDRAEAPLRIVQRVCEALRLPLHSLEIELGPSQVEAVFGVTGALEAADNMVLFRSAVKQALRRAGYHATFMCRPPFANVISSGWHLHQSLYELASGANAFMRRDPHAAGNADDARSCLSDLGAHYLAGLLRHAEGTAAFCTPTVNGYGRYRPNALAPQSIVWGRDNRGAMLRVIGSPGDPGTRIENRAGEPLANPYLYLASQIHAGLDGIERQIEPPPATRDLYANGADQLPTSLEAALKKLAEDELLAQAFGTDFINYFTTVKNAELRRFREAPCADEFFSREYFARF